MTQKGYCKICSWLESHRWYKASIQKEVAEAKSLRHLQTYFRALGLECDLKTISKHVKVCMDMDAQTHRQIEKAKRKKPVEFIQKLKEIFGKEQPLTPKECQHIRTIPVFDVVSERVHVKCVDCRQILGDFDIETHREQMRNDARNLVVYDALARKRRQ